MKIIGQKLTYDYVKGEFEKRGFHLLSKEYNSNKEKLEVKCSKEHIFTQTYNDFQQGCGCPVCYGNKRLSYEYVKEQFKKEGYELISTEYKNSKSKLNVKCPKGHIFDITYGNFYSGYRCSHCYVNKKKTYEFVKEQIEKEGHILLSTKYENNGKKLKVKCQFGHTWDISYNSFYMGCRCPHCSHIEGGSTPEKELLRYIKTLYSGVVVENDRKTIRNYWTNRPLELDILLPDLKKAIEYGAEYYHRDDYTKWKDMMKIKQCEQKNINLIFIDDNDWKKNKDEVKKRIGDWIC